MRLEHALILNRRFHALFDARDLTELKQPSNVQEGPAADGQSYFYGPLLGRAQDAALRNKLAEYDARVMGYLDAPVNAVDDPLAHNRNRKPLILANLRLFNFGSPLLLVTPR